MTDNELLEALDLLDQLVDSTLDTVVKQRVLTWKQMLRDKIAADDGLTWTVTQNTPDETYPGQWQASVTDGTYQGWAMEKTEKGARAKALIRLKSAHEEAAYTHLARLRLEKKTKEQQSTPPLSATGYEHDA